MPQPNELFDIRRLAWVIAIGTLALMGAIYLVVFGDPDPEQTADANAFSASAIGHAAFVEILNRVGLLSYISRGHSLEKAHGNALLVVAEPPDDDIGHHLLQQLHEVPTALVILPKRRGTPDPGHPSWLTSTRLIETSGIDHLLQEIDPAATIRRERGTLQMPATASGFKASLDDAQLIYSDVMTPLISRGDKQGGGILLGKVYLGHALVWVLSDPDLIANHGLGNGDNAAIAIELVRQAMPVGGTVIFDEVIHGFAQEANLLKGLLHLPLLVASIAALCTLIALLLAGSIRFGSPRRLAPVLAAGKLTLISNAAALLAVKERRTALTERYLRVVFAELAPRLGATRTLDDTSLVAWLDQHAARQGIGRSASELLASAQNNRLSTGARMRQLQIWTREMTHGISGSTGIRPIDQHTHQS